MREHKLHVKETMVASALAVHMVRRAAQFVVVSGGPDKPRAPSVVHEE